MLCELILRPKSPSFRSGGGSLGTSPSRPLAGWTGTAAEESMSVYLHSCESVVSRPIRRRKKARCVPLMGLLYLGLRPLRDAAESSTHC